MVLSEAEAENRLAALRREREALDRAITDLTLYLELGRRLTNGAPAPDPAGLGARPSDPSPFPAVQPFGRVATPAPPPEATQEGFRASAAQAAGAVPPPGDRAGTAGPVAAAGAGSGMAECPDGAQETKSDPQHNISEGALARRYGRALIREAVAVLAEAGRPLHASEIFSALTARGFTVPGQQDPVAALNTRLWKRAGPGGPLRRLGDAIYAPAEGGEADPGEE